MTAYFRANCTGEEDDPWDFVDTATKIPCPLPLTDTDTEEGDTQSVSSFQLGPQLLEPLSVKELSPRELLIINQPWYPKKMNLRIYVNSRR